MHVSLMLVLYKAIALGFARVGVRAHVDGLDGAELLELAPDLGLARVEVDPADEERLEGVLGHVLPGTGVPQRDLLLQLVGHLLLLVALLPLQPGRKENRSELGLSRLTRRGRPYLSSLVSNFRGGGVSVGSSHWTLPSPRRSARPW